MYKRQFLYDADNKNKVDKAEVARCSAAACRKGNHSQLQDDCVGQRPLERSHSGESFSTPDDDDKV